MTAAASAGNPTGLYGVVRKGPTTPVCRVGTPCTAPAVGVKLVFRRAGNAPRFATSGAGGRYRITLPPGRYAVTVAPRTTIGRGLSPQSAVASTGVFRHVDFMLDTGIR